MTAQRVISACERIASIGEKLYYYRNSEVSIMNGSASIKKLDLIEAIYNRFRWYEDKGMDSLLDGTYHQARRNYVVMKDIRAKNTAESKRLKEVKQMYGYMFKNAKAGKTAKDYFILLAPGLYFKMRSLLRKK